ncbi:MULTISPECIES: preprotein translocase subunit SecG [unclassified Novosphingobium]|uniref:preprotein translocase subunit SecG n=1 Tax=unclassified Novosphingobium TaxID=2644732 RepID=UPI0025D6D574|nr:MULTISPECIES: preprotein translocase subunit SecG [unclassified Novosphingobium]HQV02671.1 preprotein translocase subunit SecG [Novosphingobium sp.]
MSLFIFLTVVQAIIAFLLIVVILMQKSEGGGLGVGGSPAGLMSARGAADFLTRTTAILATLFVGMSILLAALAASTGSDRPIEDTLNRSAIPQGAQPASNPLEGGSIPVTPTPAASPTPGAADPLSVPAKKQ